MRLLALLCEATGLAIRGCWPHYKRLLAYLGIVTLERNPMDTYFHDKTLLLYQKSVSVLKDEKGFRRVFFLMDVSLSYYLGKFLGICML